MSDTGFDKFTNFIYNTLDKVSTGVKSYYDAAIGYNEAQAALALSNTNKNNARDLTDLQNSTGNNSWTIPEEGESFKVASPQGYLIIGGVLLAGFALLKAK